MVQIAARLRSDRGTSIWWKVRVGAVICAALLALIAVNLLRMNDLRSDVSSDLIHPTSGQSESSSLIPYTPIKVADQAVTLSPLRLSTSSALDRSERRTSDTKRLDIVDETTTKTNPLPRPDAILNIRPTYGQHRSSENAIFTFARGFSLEKYLPFVVSLRKNTKFSGDLVLGVSDQLSDELREFFQYLTDHHHAVVYEIPLECISVNKIRTHCHTIGMFALPDGTVLRDTRSYREMAQLRFEFYWGWSTMYKEISDIWLFDARDVYFQQDFTWFKSNRQLHFFEESSVRGRIFQQKSNRLWISKAYGKVGLKQLRSYTVLCSGSSFGGAADIQAYTSAMVHQFEITNCTIYGCDQGHHNYLARTSDTAWNVSIHHQGESVVNTVGLLVAEKGNLTSLDLLDGEGQILNNDKRTVSPIIHQYDRDVQFNRRIEERRGVLYSKWRKLKRFN